MLHYFHMLDSKDILYVVLSFCALWFTAFLCFVMYQIASIAKRLHNIIDDVRNKIDDLLVTINAIRMKVEGHVSALGSVTDGIRKIMETLRGRD